MEHGTWNIIIEFRSQVSGFKLQEILFIFVILFNFKK